MEKNGIIINNLNIDLVSGSASLYASKGASSANITLRKEDAEGFDKSGKDSIVAFLREVADAVEAM